MFSNKKLQYQNNNVESLHLTIYLAPV